MSPITIRLLAVALTWVLQSCSSIAPPPERGTYQEDPCIPVLLDVLGKHSQNTSFVVECDADLVAIVQTKYPKRRIVPAPHHGALPGVIVHLVPRTVSIAKENAFVELTTTRQGQMLKKRFHLTRQSAGQWTIDDSKVVVWGW